MSLISNYHRLQQDLERLTAQHEKLSADPELKREMEFDSKLRSLLAEYSKSLPDVISIIEPAQSQLKKKGAFGRTVKTRKARTLKVYQNPTTGEIVETKGGNNKLLGKWKADYGIAEVESWLRKPGQ